MKFLKPSLENLVGMAVGILCSAIFASLCHRGAGDMRFFAETASYYAVAYGFDMWTICIIMGAIIALFISFIATHALEQYFKVDKVIKKKYTNVKRR